MSNGNASMEKTQLEKDLETAVFGDDAGFHANLKIGSETLDDRYTAADQSVSAPQESDVEIEDVDDSQLFFLDSGATPVDPPPLNTERTSSEDHDSSDQAAWVDSDDERLVVSLASNTRLRKLRLAESEDIINGVEYTKRLRRQFLQLYPTPAWALSSARRKSKRRNTHGSSTSSNSGASNASDNEMDVESNELSAQPLSKLLRDPSSFLQTPTSAPGALRKVRQETIEVHRLKDVGATQPSTVCSLSFHPQHPILLTCGPSGLVSLFHISPTTPSGHPLITNLHVRRTPLSTSTFLPPSGTKVFFSARRRYFHIWNLDTGQVAKVTKIQGHSEEQRSMEKFKLSPCGRWMGLVGTARKGGGYVNIVDANTCQWVAEVRVEGGNGVADFAWWGDGEGLVALGKGGEAVEYSLRERRVLAKWIDEGAVGTTVVALGATGGGPKALGGDRWLAVGSSSGIVNLYDRKGWRNAQSVPARPKPTRALDQLTTPTSHLAFSPDGQILCMSSRWKRDALRLVHLPSCTVYKNWPTSATPLGRISAVAWSANSEMLAAGNEQGKVRLWEVRG